MTDLVPSPDAPVLPPSTSLDITLLNCLQRLEMLEHCTGVLVQAAQTQVDHHQEYQRLLLTLSQQASTTQHLLESLNHHSRQSPAAPMVDWQSLTQQVAELAAEQQRQSAIGRGLAGVAIASITGLALYLGWSLHPALTTTQAVVARQQTVLNHLLVCTVNSQAPLCTELRRAIAHPRRSP